MRARFEVIGITCQRYQAATRKGKSLILDEFTQVTGYSRKYASFVLRNWHKEVSARIHNKLLRFVVGKRRGKPRTGRPPLYNAAFIAVLEKLWKVFDCLCGKRLVPFLRAVSSRLNNVEGTVITDDIRNKLLSLSPATADRLLAKERKTYQLRGTSHTKPGSLLKNQIPIRTFSDWDEAGPGFTEVDLVAHEGGCAYGEFHCTLTMTDIAVGWTETVAIQTKAQRWAIPAIDLAIGRFPFPILGIDCDNGGEFINKTLCQYCERHRITFTRSRPYRKNDNCFVEQKNNSVVRRAVGWARYDSPESLELLNALYLRLRLMNNFFMPSAKLLRKTRDGARVIREHDTPKTPYERILELKTVSESIKDSLRAQYAKLDLVSLAKDIKIIQRKLDQSFTPITYSTRGQYLAQLHKKNQALPAAASG